MTRITNITNNGEMDQEQTNIRLDSLSSLSSSLSKDHTPSLIQHLFYKFNINFPNTPLCLRSPTLIYALTLIAVTVDSLNTAGSLTLIPSLSLAFPNVPLTTISWCFSAYALTLGAFIIISGKLCDLLGTRGMFIVGLFGMGISVLICGFIQDNIIILIVFRAIQGMFGSVLIPASFTITKYYYEEGEKLELACKLMTICIEGSLALGLIIAGAFTELKTVYGFRAFYWYSAGISLSSGSILLFIMDPIHSDHKLEAKEIDEDDSRPKLKDLDYGGCLLLIAGLILIIYGLTKGGEDNWQSSSSIICIIIGFIVVSIVVVFEMWYVQRYKNKHQHVFASSDWRIRLNLLFPRELLHIPNFIQYLCGVFLIFTGFVAILALTLQYHVYVESMTPFQASIRTLTLTFGLLLITFCYSEKWMRWIGVRQSLVLSCLISLGGTVWLSRLNSLIENSYWKYEFGSLIVTGIGLNFYFMIYMNAILANTPMELQGLVSGVLQTMGQIGVSIGNAVIASILGELKQELDLSEYAQGVLTKKFQKGFYVPMASFAMMAIVCLFIKVPQSNTEETDVVTMDITIDSNNGNEKVKDLTVVRSTRIASETAV